MDRCHGRPRELTGARPPATPGLKVVGEGAGEVEEAAASTFVGSSELGRRGNGGAAERDGQQWSVLSEVGVADSGGAKEGGGDCGDGRGWSSPFYSGREEGSGRGRRRNGRRGDGNLMPRPLELELFHGVKEGGGKTGEHMADEVMHELLVVQDRWKAMQNGGAQWRPLAVAASVVRGQGRPQLGREWAKRSLGQTGADGPAR
jgi:hypothetical protein